jgi:hypothetical protein
MDPFEKNQLLPVEGHDHNRDQHSGCGAGLLRDGLLGMIGGGTKISFWKSCRRAQLPSAASLQTRA